jgi:hypothetical protein
VLVTTHSPAILDAAEGELNENVVVCHRNSLTGYSDLTPLMDVAGYARALAQGSLGDAVTQGRLLVDLAEAADLHGYGEFERLLGLR